MGMKRDGDMDESYHLVMHDQADAKLDAIFEYVREIPAMKRDIGELKADVKGLKFDVKLLQFDVRDLKKNVKELKSDMVDVKQRLGKIVAK
jgi:hypothetical protein